MYTFGRLLIALSCCLGINQTAVASNNTEQACKSDCVEKPGASNALGATPGRSAQSEDEFDGVNRINKASIVMLSEEGIVTAEMASKIATAVKHVIEQGQKPDGPRPADVLDIEHIMIEDIGPDASIIHSGRSRQDIYATYRLAELRAQTLQYGDGVNLMRTRLIDLAAKHIETWIPAYTNGVQAMPISLAHYLLAYEDSLERDAQRLHELYARLNLSPMGTAVLANSAWPLNRERLAELLGFDGVRENSLDASQVSTYDIPIEAANIAASSAIRIGALIGDIHMQYHQTRPWILLDEGSTYTSSAMPQKRNPGLLMRTRESASDTVSRAQGITLRAHNVTTGMTDYKFASETNDVFGATQDMFTRMDQVLRALVIDPQRAAEELGDDWTTSMELADTLERDYKVPFRIGHSFASLIVGEARQNNFKPANFPYSAAQRLFTQAAEKYQWKTRQLPLDEKAFRATLSPETMARTRVGTGGPQPAEVRRMLAGARQSLESDQTWLNERRQRLADASTALDKAFYTLAEGR